MGLAGCAVGTAEQAGPYPFDYHRIVKAHVEETFFDPYSLRSVALGTPQLGRLFFQTGWIVCLRANAKNRLGAYVGLKDYALLIREGKVVQSLTDAPLCQEMAMIPWPEMDAGQEPGAAR